jgi:hypothetical protein
MLDMDTSAGREVLDRHSSSLIWLLATSRQLLRSRIARHGFRSGDFSLVGVKTSSPIELIERAKIQTANRRFVLIG